jgi:indole-3-pyruvate monooxygenase
MSDIERTNTVIVGAGPGGLAVGACLHQVHLPFLILEQAGQVGSKWSQHYDRLHLHTDSLHSALPYWPWPKGSSRYPSRQDVLDYLERYAEHFELQPRFGQRVCSAERRQGTWLIRTQDSAYEAPNLVVATGLNRQPNRPTWPEQETYQGQILQSAEYRNGSPFAGQAVLVVGLGNSGAEIAIDLTEHGALPTLAVRSPVTIVPREILGLPILYLAIPLRHVPAKLADVLSGPMVRAAARDSKRLGLPVPPHRPDQQIRDIRKVPVIDVGTVNLIRKGRIKVRPGIECFTRTGVQFTDGTIEDFSAVILATGYRPGVTAFLAGVGAALDASGAPLRSGRESGVPGLFFCAFRVASTGALREIALEVRQIAHVIRTLPG